LTNLSVSQIIDSQDELRNRLILVIDVGAYYGVSRSYIFRCLKEIAPERRRQMVQSIIVLCFWPEMMARMQILAGRID
jgi:hypothetical protein